MSLTTGTESNPVDPPTAMWLADDEDEDKLDELEPKVLDRHDLADFINRLASVAPRRKARKLREQAARLAATGSTRKRRRRGLVALAKRTVLRRHTERPAPRQRELGRGRSHARRGPPASDEPHPAPHPDPAQTDVDVVFLDALARFETLREFDELALCSLRKAAFLFSIGWPR